MAAATAERSASVSSILTIYKFFVCLFEASIGLIIIIIIISKYFKVRRKASGAGLVCHTENAYVRSAGYVRIVLNIRGFLS